MEKLICDINGTLIAKSGIVHGVVTKVAGSDTKNEGSTLPKNIAPQRRMSQLLHVKENENTYLEEIALPVVSGNAFRGILRRLIVEHSFDVLDLSIEEIYKDLPGANRLSHDIWFMFNNGGLTPKGSAVKASSLAAYDDILSIPWLGLLGAVYNGHQFEGSSSYGTLYPLIKENADFYMKDLNLSEEIISKLPSYSILQTLPLCINTRKANSRDNSARDSKAAKAVMDKKETPVDPGFATLPEDPDAMIYGSEYIPAGIQLVSINRCTTHNPDVMKAFKAAIALFLSPHRIIGGRSASGFGRVAPGLGFDINPEELIADYDNMLKISKDELIRKMRRIATDMKFTVSEKKDSKKKG